MNVLKTVIAHSWELLILLILIAFTLMKIQAGGG